MNCFQRKKSHSKWVYINVGWIFKESKYQAQILSQISQIMIVGVISYLPNFKVVKSNHVMFGFQIFKIQA
jgi:hypothetical protein